MLFVVGLCGKIGVPKKRVSSVVSFIITRSYLVLLSRATQIVYKVVSEVCKLFSLEAAKVVVLYMDSLTLPELTEFLLGFVLRAYKTSPVALCR